MDQIEQLRETLTKSTSRYLAVPLTYKDTTILRELRNQPCEPRVHALARFYPQGEAQSCKVCGAVDGWDFTVDDVVWRQVVPELYQEHVVCLACFDGLAAKSGIVVGGVRQATFAGAAVTLHVAPPEAPSPDELLQEIWEDCMDSHPRGVRAMEQTLYTLRRLNMISQERAELWRLRAKTTCPEADSGHGGGRAWCAYCGDIKHSEETEEAAR